METDVLNRGKSPGISREVIFRLRGLLPVPAILVMFAWAEPTVRSFLYGGLLVLAGEAIRLWAAGYIKKYRVSEVQADELVTAGPYAYVRNPLYWGNFLIGLGFAVIADWWPAYVLFLAVYLYIYSSVIPLEEAYLRETFGQSYDEYARSVPRFIPRLRPHPGPEGVYSARVAFTGEMVTIVVLGVVATLFALKMLF
mgnify:CR=1 FL=1